MISLDSDIMMGPTTSCQCVPVTLASFKEPFKPRPRPESFKNQTPRRGHRHSGCKARRPGSRYHASLSGRLVPAPPGPADPSPTRRTELESHPLSTRAWPRRQRGAGTTCTRNGPRPSGRTITARRRASDPKHRLSIVQELQVRRHSHLLPLDSCRRRGSLDGLRAVPHAPCRRGAGRS